MCCVKKEPPKHSTNLLTLDGSSYFPRDFVDFKQFNSTKAHAIEESDEEEEVKFDQQADAEIQDTAQKKPP